MEIMAKIRNFEGCGTFCQEADVSNTTNDGEKKQRETVKKNRL